VYLSGTVANLAVHHCSLFLQREGAEDILDFWLDVQQHENLCRAYFKDIRKSGRALREDWPEYWEYARKRGSIYGSVVGSSSAPGAHHLSQAYSAKRSTASTGDLEKAAERGLSARSPSPGGPADVRSPTAVGSDFEPARSTTPFSLSGRTPTLFTQRRASRAPTVIPRSGAITRQELIRSAEYIHLRYLSPAGQVGATENHEIYLPPALRVHAFPLSGAHEPRGEAERAALAQVPDMFHAQKEYVFRAMEQDAFPRFLRAKAFGNLTPVSALVRLVAGLICLWVALAAAFALVFLDVQPKSKRFFVSALCESSHVTAPLTRVPPAQLFIPFTLAFLFLISHQYELDPILVFFNRSESTPFRTLPIREPYVKKLLLGRALWVTILVSLCVAAFTLLFWAVPGHRL
jgi:hypothetical protein